MIKCSKLSPNKSVFSDRYLQDFSNLALHMNIQILRLFCFISFLFLAGNGTLLAQNARREYTEASVLKKEGKSKKAIQQFEMALETAQRENNDTIALKCHLELAELQNNFIHYKEALNHYRAFTRLYRKLNKEKTEQLTDSVGTLHENLSESQATIASKEITIDALTKAQLKAQLRIQQKELENQVAENKLAKEQQQSERLYSIVSIIAIVLLGLLLLYLRKRNSAKILQNKNVQIAIEKDKSEQLLLNILPTSVANELKTNGKTVSKRYESTTVMFTDFKGFTTFASENNPEDVVAMLDFYFKAFDEIISRFEIEKIKTIGDAYLCVAGAPTHNPKHVSHILEAALLFQEFVRKNADHSFGNGSELLEMRIGIHTGPLVAGVVGSKKFAFDIWGDTVNVAARMEQASISGQINVSEDVYQLEKHNYQFQHRGEIEAKNKGLMNMYFLVGKK